MIVTWNVRGINKQARHREISSYISTFSVPICALLETKVKQNNADKIRKSFGPNWKFEDNYEHNSNGRICILWKHNKVNIKVLKTNVQFIHVEVYALDQTHMQTIIVTYAFNQLEHKRRLWKDIELLSNNTSSPWIVMGDFNNVASCQERIGGKEVTEAKFRDLIDMLQMDDLFEATTKGPHFTWTNKHTTGVIYSTIDRVLGNTTWY
ncbi:unnamed protein product [Lathyrus sativus]|nr:unnamed protein product [Lathyrus sativus]